MKHFDRIRHIALIAMILIASGCQKKESSAPELTLFVAASLTEVIQEIGAAYSESHPVELHYNFASSGTLAQQINAAPRADIFLSASTHWMDAVQQQIISGTRESLLSNRLVVITRADSPLDAKTNPNYRYIAMGDPAHVPAGTYAQQWLDQTNWAHADAIQSLCPDAPSIVGQVLSRDDVIGIVYHSDFFAHKDKLRIYHEPAAQTLPTIEYPVALLKESASARAFLEYLKSDEARAIFEKHGFLLNSL